MAFPALLDAIRFGVTAPESLNLTFGAHPALDLGGCERPSRVGRRRTDRGDLDATKRWPAPPRGGLGAGAGDEAVAQVLACAPMPKPGGEGYRSGCDRAGDPWAGVLDGGSFPEGHRLVAKVQGGDLSVRVAAEYDF